MISCLPKWCRSVRFWLELYLCAMLALCSRQIVAALDERFAPLWKAIAGFLASNPAANALTAAGLTAAIIALCHTRRLSPIFSPSWVMWSVVAMIYCAAPGVLRVPIAGELDYSVVVFAGALMLCIIELIKLFPVEKQTSTDTPYLMESTAYFPDGRERFADTVARRISATHGSEAFAIGISGAWGSGKSTFLSYLENRLGKSPDIAVRFRPWNSSSANTIVSDFFETMASTIAPCGNSLKRMFRRYASLLSAGGLTVAESLADKLTGDNDGLSELKEKIEDALGQLSYRVYVFIDDMDRLDREEILQVLKLIRNTANFPQLTYVVTYDREYIVSIIGSDNGRGNDFIEKIFHLEIALPGVEEYAMPKVIWDAVGQLLNDYPKQKDALYHQLLLTKNGHLFEHYCLSAYITNYRQALRFANVLSNHISFLIKNESARLSDLDFRELFWLEVLRYAYPEIYRTLDHNRNELLDIKGEGYKLKADAGIDENARWLLESLFENFPRHNSIAHPHNYGHYFALRKYDNHLSESEFEAMLSDEKNLEETLDVWYERRPPVRLSAEFHFRSYEVEKSAPERALIYFKALSRWMALVGDDSLINIFKEKSDTRGGSRLLENDDYKIEFESAILSLIENANTSEYATRLVASLKPSYMPEDDAWWIRHLLDHKGYGRMVDALVERLDREQQILPDDFFDQTSPIVRMLSSTSIVVGQEPTRIDIYQVFGWKRIKEILRDRKSSSDLRQLAHRLHEGYIQYDGGDGGYYEYENYEDHIRSVFGSDNAFEQFCVDFFIGDNVEKRKIFDECAKP